MAMSWSQVDRTAITPRCTTRSPRHGALLAVSTQSAVRDIQRRCYPTARSWLPAATTPLKLARNCMTRPLGRGVAAATSTQATLVIQQRCCRTARSWSRAAIAKLHLTVTWQMSCTTRPLELGASPAISTKPTTVVRRCCSMARSWSLGPHAALPAVALLAYMIQRQRRGAAPPIPTQPAMFQRPCCLTGGCLSQGGKRVIQREIAASFLIAPSCTTQAQVKHRLQLQLQLRHQHRLLLPLLQRRQRLRRH